MQETAAAITGGIKKSAVRHAFERIVRWCAVIAASAATVLVVAVSLDVLNRRTVGGSLPGLLELNQTLLVVIVFLAIPYGERVGVHVRMTLVTSRLPEKIARICRTVAYLLATGIIGWMAYASVLRAIDSFVRSEAQLGLVMWPLWPARWVLAFGLCLLTIQCAFKVADAVKGLPLDAPEPGADVPAASHF